MDKIEVLQKCTIEGNVVSLPDIELDRKLYMEVKKALELIGGKWKSRPVYGFVFPEDPTELLNSVKGGDKRNVKKEIQFFATPDELAYELVEHAEISNIDAHARILEPSAGQGALLTHLFAYKQVKQVDCCEISPVNRIFLKKFEGVLVIADDFLALDSSQKFRGYYDRIIANPPFAKNQDITHIYKMYDCLKPGGRLVSMASKHWQLSNNTREKVFKAWLEEIGADIIEVPSGVFKESGTMIATVIIIIEK